MNDHDLCDDVAAVLHDAEGGGHLAEDPPGVDDEQRWTRREWQRLLFLRWLHCQGRLSEWR